MRAPPQSAARALFGPLRTLNVRASRLSGRDSAARVEAWLRSKQVELSGEVLIITGRGAGSLDGIPVIREWTRKVLSRLRRQGVIASFGEDTPGSYVVTLAPLRALLEAPARRRSEQKSSPARPPVIAGLRRETRDRLRHLAEQSVDSLGVRHPTAAQVSAEMARQFSIVASTAPPGVDVDRWIDGAIAKAIREYEESGR